MATNKRIYALIGAFICSITFMGATGCDEQDKILSDKYPMLTSGAQTTTTAKTTTAPKATTTKATTTEPPKTTMVTSSGTTASVSTDVPYDEEAGGNPEHTDTEIIEVTINEDKYICNNREISLYSLYNMIDKAKENGAVTVVIHDANATLKAYNALAEFLDSEEIDYIVEL
ncbi:MAG: hypothetical protein E7507_04685 [Ruminococcus sp.]|nr:hypothetical protein [Ruminococcus sp.]